MEQARKSGKGDATIKIMNTPEREIHPIPIDHKPEQLEGGNAFQELGIRPTQVHPPTIQDPNGQIVAQSSNPIIDPNNQDHIVTVPVDLDTAENLSHGKADDSSTWFGAFVVRTIHRAIKAGFQVFVK